MLSPYATGVLELEFQLGKTTYPIRPELPIFLFRTLEDAKKRMMGNLILECEYEESPIKEFFGCNWGHASDIKYIEQIIKQQTKRDLKIPGASGSNFMPQYMILASSVKPIREVD